MLWASPGSSLRDYSWWYSREPCDALIELGSTSWKASVLHLLLFLSPWSQFLTYCIYADWLLASLNCHNLFQIGGIKTQAYSFWTSAHTPPAESSDGTELELGKGESLFKSFHCVLGIQRAQKPDWQALRWSTSCNDIGVCPREHGWAQGWPLLGVVWLMCLQACCWHLDHPAWCWAQGHRLLFRKGSITWVNLTGTFRSRVAPHWGSSYKEILAEAKLQNWFYPHGGPWTAHPVYSLQEQPMQPLDIT